MHAITVYLEPNMKRRNPSGQYSHLTRHHASNGAHIEQHTRYRIPFSRRTADGGGGGDGPAPLESLGDQEHSDFFNYVLLIVLYTLQGIPMGLSASIPFLIQQKIKMLASTTGQAAASAAAAATAESVMGASANAAASRLAYNANAIFALCSWPFSLKLLWAPIVDACFIRSIGRRKSWLIPAQAAAGILMVTGANFVERQLGLDSSMAAAASHSTDINVKGVTAFFFCLYFLMATQDIAVDGWALTLLSKKNRGRGPVCNSIGQNIGYFLSFVGFLALNDAESSESLWRPLLGLPSNPEQGLVSLQSFIRWMGYFMLVTTTAVALFKRENVPTVAASKSTNSNRLSDATEALLQGKSLLENDLDPSILESDNVNRRKKDDGDEADEDRELDASEIGLKETYHRLWEVCKLPSVRWLFLILLTYRLPTALSDNVKFLKAVEYGLSKSTTALLSPTIILPLGILVPIVATKIWHGHPLRQFMSAYKVRVTLTPLVDVLLLWLLQQGKPATRSGTLVFWGVLVLSTALQATVNSLQFNAQMTFFAHRVDPAIGGSYMTLLNTAANLGGTWPASLVMWFISRLTKAPVCTDVDGNVLDSATVSAGAVCTSGRDPYFMLQLALSVLGCLWIATLGGKVGQLAALPDEAWRTHILDNDEDDDRLQSRKTRDITIVDAENGDLWNGTIRNIARSISGGSSSASDSRKHH